jgi:hypothetical protein
VATVVFVAIDPQQIGGAENFPEVIVKAQRLPEILLTLASQFPD